MATHGNSAPKNSDRRFSVCLCLFRPCRACLVSNEGNGDTPDTSDNLPPTPNHIGYPNGNRTPDRTFLGFRLKKTPDPADADLMESFPLASLTLARLKNPTGEADVIYGSLQQLQKISMEESPSRFVTANSINGIYETCMTQSRSCSTQTTPVSMPVSPETVSPYHTIFDRPAPDDAELWYKGFCWIFSAPFFWISCCVLETNKWFAPEIPGILLVENRCWSARSVCCRNVILTRWLTSKRNRTKTRMKRFKWIYP